jgi:predicted ABC-type transport system involved in lysophospholipase L1 biosynthesis ATPase subunit
MSGMPKLAETNAKTLIEGCLIEIARSMVQSDDHELPVLPEVSVQLMQVNRTPIVGHSGLSGKIHDQGHFIQAGVGDQSTVVTGEGKNGSSL